MPILTGHLRPILAMGSACPLVALARRWVMKGIAVLTLAMLGVAMQAGSQTLEGSVIAGGGGRSASIGKCLRLDTIIAQPLAGVSSGGIFTLASGFLAGRGDNESIFHHGFEVCS